MTSKEITLYFARCLIGLVENPGTFKHWVEYRRHRAAKLIATREYKVANVEEVRARNKRYRDAHKSEIAESDRDYRETHKDTERSRVAAFQKSPKGLAGQRRWRKHKKETDPNFKIRVALSTRLWEAVKNSGVKKSAPTLELCGLNSWAEFWNHMEPRFREGMTRSNHGAVWEIDHIKPCASFDLTNPAQQRACFHYTNLQPLCVSENRSKGARV